MIKNIVLVFLFGFLLRNTNAQDEIDALNANSLLDLLNAMESDSSKSGNSRIINSEPNFVIVPSVPKPDAKGTCSGSFTENTGEIASPNYPNENYPSEANCSWDIRVEEGKIIMMEFTYMDIEVGPPECPFDGVLIVDYGDMWNTGLSHHLGGPVALGVSDPQVPPTALGRQRYCGQETFKPFFSITNAVRVGFYSDDNSQASGFVLSWTAVDAVVEEVTEETYSCDFENGLCPGWENIQSNEDSFDWAITNGKTKTENTGPDFDHTKKNDDGRYAYIEGSKPQRINDTALLSSTEFQFEKEEKEFCLDFWYHMYGEGIGSLVIGIAQGDERSIKWMKEGNQDNKWLNARVTIEQLTGPFKIIFAGVRGNSYTADIAIDDIALHRKPCSTLMTIPDETPCAGDDYPCMNSSVCIRDFQLCDGTSDCPENDDESEFICVVSETTIAPPPFDGTTTYETSMTTEFDVASDMMTTVPLWMTNLTTFSLEETTNVNNDATSTQTAENTTPRVNEETTTTATTTTTTQNPTTVEVEETTDTFTTGKSETTESNDITTEVEDTTAREQVTELSTSAPTTMQSTTTTTEKYTTAPIEVTTTPKHVNHHTTERTEPQTTEAAIEITDSVEKYTHTTIATETSTELKSNIETTTQDIVDTTSISSTTKETLKTTKQTDGKIEKPIEVIPRTPRPSPNSLITAVAIEPTGVAEKLQDDNGNSATKLSSRYIACVSVLLVSWILLC